MLSSIQKIDPCSDDKQVRRQLQTMKDELGEDKHSYMTRYDLNHQSEELGRTPIDFADVRLKYCNAFNVAMKAAKQCRELTVLDRAKWPNYTQPGSFLQMPDNTLGKLEMSFFYGG